MIDKKIKCIHCGNELYLNPPSVAIKKCTCGKVSLNNGVIIEGSRGSDWVDISPQLLNE